MDRPDIKKSQPPYGEELVTRYMNEYKYGLRFRMCMREFKMWGDVVRRHRSSERVYCLMAQLGEPMRWSRIMFIILRDAGWITPTRSR